MNINKIGTYSFLLLIIFSACAKELPPPNIVWITSEDNSKHYMSLFDENGIETPNIERLAQNGVTFTHAFSNAAVCSAARSTLISGCYGPRAATHYHRKLQMVPMPDGVEMYPAYLKAAGYYTANHYKEDYNIFKSDTVWDASNKKADWRNRAEGQPFFYVHNILTTHESRLHFSQAVVDTFKTKANPKEMFIQPNHPHTNLFEFTNAYYRDKVVQMDTEVGEVVAELEKDGLMENTFIFYFGDHGGVLPGSKGYILETGLHVPLVVYVPEKYKHLVSIEKGEKAHGFVSFVDFGPTLLHLVGIDIPEGMDGNPFLGKDISKKELESRDETFSYADRFDEKYDMVRAFRKGKYKYMRNYQPFNFDGLMNNYRYKQLAYQEWSVMHNTNDLNAVQSQFFNSKDAEALYDVEADPFETVNLAQSAEHQQQLKELREKLNEQVSSMPDLSFFPEFYLIKNAFDNPVKFGQANKDRINNYIQIANLSLLDFADAKTKIEASLHSSDAWERYWALIVCSSFGDEAKVFTAQASKLAKTDNELINRVRAAEFLGLIGWANPVKVMSKALYDCNDGNEALLILNSIVLMQDGPMNYEFNLELSKMNDAVKNHQMVKWRLNYLGVIEA